MSASGCQLLLYSLYEQIEALGGLGCSQWLHTGLIQCIQRILIAKTLSVLENTLALRELHTEIFRGERIMVQLTFKWFRNYFLNIIYVGVCLCRKEMIR